MHAPAVSTVDERQVPRNRFHRAKTSPSCDSNNERVISATNPLPENEAPIFLTITNNMRRAGTDQCRRAIMSTSADRIIEWGRIDQPQNGVVPHYSRIQEAELEDASWADPTTFKVPPSFWAHEGMMVTITKNLAVPLGVCNGARGRIIKFFFRPDTVFHATESGTTRASLPPYAVLLEMETAADIRIEGLEERQRMVFLDSQRATVNGVSYNYKGQPLRFGRALTINSAQGLTIKSSPVVLP